jgi:hypothetical protein
MTGQEEKGFSGDQKTGYSGNETLLGKPGFLTDPYSSGSIVPFCGQFAALYSAAGEVPQVQIAPVAQEHTAPIVKNDRKGTH